MDGMYYHIGEEEKWTNSITITIKKKGKLLAPYFIYIVFDSIYLKKKENKNRNYI